MTYFKEYSKLPNDAVLIRTKVFIEEQGFIDEIDDIDAFAKHIVLYSEDKPAATCRYFWNDKINSYAVGRIAVLKEFRGKHLGAAVLCEAERKVKELGGIKLMLASQLRVKGFYEKQGYVAEGEEFFEEDCPHIWMYKNLE